MKLYPEYVPIGNSLEAIETNLRFRRKIWDMGNNNPQEALAINKMCAEDILFWINTFCWTRDPRVLEKYGTTDLPFLTWEKQNEIVLTIQKCLGVKDAIFGKSRDEGLSYLLLLGFIHPFIFNEGVNFLVASRNADYVDKKGNPKALFWKIDYILKRLPVWMISPLDIERTDMHIAYKKKDNSIDGEATGPNLGAGSRYTAALLDEFSKLGERADSDYGAFRATRDCTNSRFFNGTPNGAYGMFYDLWNDDKQFPDIERVIVHWSTDPRKNKGLYQVSVDGKIEVIDEAYYKNRSYEFITKKPSTREGYRSPWYDAECRNRFASDVAQELDINFLGSGHRFFDEETIESLMAEFVMPPMLEGSFTHDFGDNGKFYEAKDGLFKLWTHLEDGQGRPVDRGPYVLGIDISAGTGQSNSVISIGNIKTGEKVAEYANSAIHPNDLAELAIAMAKFFYDAKIIHDGFGGGGGTFGDKLTSLRYGNVYRHRDPSELGAIQAKKPGYFMKGEQRERVFRIYQEALIRKSFINRSAEAMKETRQYVFDAGKVRHSSTLTTDTSGEGEALHGDRVIADALCCIGMNEFYQKPETKVMNDDFIKNLLKDIARDKREKAEKNWMELTAEEKFSWL